MEKTIEAHLSRIQAQFAKGRGILRSLHENDLTTYDIPDVSPDRNFTGTEPPRDDDKYAASLPFSQNLTNTPPHRFYLSTDERDATSLAYLSAHNAILASDLLTIDDRRAFGWPLMLTDVLGLVEQAVLARAHFFYAHALSSFAGGTVNMRAVEGLDPRTAVID